MSDPTNAFSPASQMPPVERARAQLRERQQGEARNRRVLGAFAFHVEEVHAHHSRHEELRVRAAQWDGDDTGESSFRKEVRAQSTSARWRRALILILCAYLPLEAFMLMDVLDHELAARSS